jgi:DNA-binding IclR family transcriptional regulator
VQALERILAILDSVSRSRSGATPVKVAEDTGLSLSTVARLMVSMQEYGVLTRSDGSGAYELGPRLIGVVGRGTQMFEVRTALLRILERLRDECGGETTALHVRTGIQRVCVATANTVHASGRIVQVGIPMPLPGTATGHVLLANVADDLLETIVAELALPPKAEKTLRRRVDKARRDGYDITANESVEGIRGVAVPIPGDDGLGALSLAGPADRLRTEMLPEMVVKLQEAAELIAGAGLRPSALAVI